MLSADICRHGAAAIAIKRDRGAIAIDTSAQTEHHSLK
jgi:hypothetical protein